jgi:hypothetical protein
MWVKFYAFPQCAVKGLKVKNGMGKPSLLCFSLSVFHSTNKEIRSSGWVGIAR